jgi:hypothetical protein
VCHHQIVGKGMPQRHGLGFDQAANQNEAEAMANSSHARTRRSRNRLRMGNPEGIVVEPDRRARKFIGDRNRRRQFNRV